MTLTDHVTAAGAELARAGIGGANARLDAELLARHVLGWDRATYFSRRDGHPPAWFEGRYADAIARRSRREPVTLITGRREFWGLDFEVTRHVLTPRPETELIVEEALTLATRHGEPEVIVDAGTGSGCLAVALATVFPRGRVVGTDLSVEALHVARRNAERHGVAGRIAWVQTDYLSALTGPIDLIVSNPPYVPAGSLRGLPPEVRDFEPALALVSGADGLDGIRMVLAQASSRLARAGWLVFEFGYGQEDEVCATVARGADLQVVRIREDLQGIPRTAVVRRSSEL